MAKSLVSITVAIAAIDGIGNASGIRSTLTSLATLVQLPAQQATVKITCEYEDWEGWRDTIADAVASRPVGIAVTLKPSWSEAIAIRKPTPMDHLFEAGEAQQADERIDP